MASEYTLDRHDELLIAIALVEYARKWASAEPAITGSNLPRRSSS